MVKESTNMMRI